MRLSPETCRVKPLRIKNAIVASCWTYFTNIGYYFYYYIMSYLFDRFLTCVCWYCICINLSVKYNLKIWARRNVLQFLTYKKYFVYNVYINTRNSSTYQISYFFIYEMINITTADFSVSYLCIMSETDILQAYKYVTWNHGSLRSFSLRTQHNKLQSTVCEAI